MSEYLSFENEEPYNRKTKHVGVYSKKHGDYLGMIKWFARWRQYTFFPAPGTTWSRGCLRDVEQAIRLLEQERKFKREAEKKPKLHKVDESCNCSNGIGCALVPYDQW